MTDQDARREAVIRHDYSPILEWSGEVGDDVVFLLRLLDEARTEVRRETVEQIIAMLEDTEHGDWPGLLVMIERIRALAPPAKEPT